MLILWGVASFLFSTPEKEIFRLTLWIAAPLIPLYTLVNLRQSAMRGLNQVTHAMLAGFYYSTWLNFSFNFWRSIIFS